MTRAGQRKFITRPYRCPACRPIATEVRYVNGVPIAGFVPEATYVGFLATTSFEGHKPIPRTCPACGSTLVPARKDGA